MNLQDLIELKNQAEKEALKQTGHYKNHTSAMTLIWFINNVIDKEIQDRFESKEWNDAIAEETETLNKMSYQLGTLYNEIITDMHKNKE